MEATTQLNVRMSSSLKKSGDEALAHIGLSPTQAVRALWEKASRRGEGLEEVATLLCERKGHATRESSHADETLAAGWAIMDEAYRKLGIDPSVKFDLPSDRELLEEALYERMIEKGLA